MTKLDFLCYCIVTLQLVIMVTVLYLHKLRSKFVHSQTLLADLDAVLNTYSGNYKEGEIPPPREGAEKFLQKLSQHFKVEVFTARDIKQTIELLIQYKLDKYISNVSNVKNPRATVLIDDRALRFEGDYDKTLADVMDFKSYWKKK